MRAFLKITICVFVLLLVSCKDNVVFSSFERFDEEKGWAKKVQPSFVFENKDTTQLYDVFINVRHAESYPFRNLFIFLHTTDPKGSKSTDTIECILADERGKWLGSGMGDLYDNNILYKKNTHFKHPGKYTFAFEQAMRYGDKNVIDPLPLIMDIGLTIEKPEE